MSKIINHDVRVVDGKTIYMPPWVEGEEEWGNLEIPDLSVADTTQKYPISTKFVDGDRVYKYAKAGGTLREDEGAGFNRVQCVSYAAVQAIVAQYATSLTCTVGASDGHAADGGIAVNELAGGYIVIMDATGTGLAPQTLLIKSNTVVSGGGTMTVVVDGKIHVALTTSDHVEIMASPYSYVCNGTYSANYQDYKVGVPMVAATVGQWLWLQTWGITWLSPQTGVGVNQGGSAAANNHVVVFRHDGSLDTMTYNDVTHSGQAQIAGYVVCRGTAGAQGAPFVCLTIAP